MILTFAQAREIERVVLNAACPLDAYARLLLCVLLMHYNHKTGVCNPSIALLAKETRMSETTIRNRLRVLEKHGCLKREQQGHSDTYDFILFPPPWKPERGSGGSGGAPPAGGGGSSERKNTPSEGSSAAPKQEKNSCLTKQNRATGAAARTLMRQIPDDIAALIRKLQQVPGKPGCAYDRLLPKVLAAIERCGQTAVEDLYALVAPEKGKMPPWRLYQMLDGLEAHSDRQARPEPEPLPPDAPLIVEAKAAIRAADFNMRARASIEARIRAAHVDFMSFWWREDPHKLAQALARTIATEKGITP